MASVSILASLIFSQLVILVSAQDAKCPTSFHCGDLGMIQFPFTNAKRQDCGLLIIHGCDSDDPSAVKYIQFGNIGELFQVTSVGESFVSVRDYNLQEKLLSRNCEAFTHNRSLPLITSAMASFHFDYQTSTIIRCNRTVNVSFLGTYDSKYTSCSDYDLYLGYNWKRYPKGCSKVQLQIQNYNNIKDPFTSIAAEIPIRVKISDDCSKCHYERGGQCRLDTKGHFFCAKEETEKTVLIVATAVGVLGCVMLLACFFRRKVSSSSFLFFWKKRDPTNQMTEEFLQTYESLPTTSDSVKFNVTENKI